MRKISTIMILCLFGVCSNVSACAWNINGPNVNYYPNPNQTTLGSLEQLSNTKKVYLDTCSIPYIAYLDSNYWTDCRMTNFFTYPATASLIESSNVLCTNTYVGTCRSPLPVSSCSSVKERKQCNESYISDKGVNKFCGYEKEGPCRNTGGVCQSIWEQSTV